MLHHVVLCFRLVGRAGQIAGLSAVCVNDGSGVGLRAPYVGLTGLSILIGLRICRCCGSDRFCGSACCPNIMATARGMAIKRSARVFIDSPLDDEAAFFADDWVGAIALPLPHGMMELVRHFVC